MSTKNASMPRKRRPKKILSPSAKYETWLRLVRDEATISQAATAIPGDNMSARRALVTGATGYIGSRLVPALLRAGWTVRVGVGDHQVSGWAAP